MINKKRDWQIRTELSNGTDISTVELKNPRDASLNMYETCVFYPRASMDFNKHSEVIWCGHDQMKALKNHMSVVNHESLRQLAQENPTDFPQALYDIG